MDMWKDYSADYLKHNRLSGVSARLAAFICALCLSLLCGLFYNAWKYEVERIVLEEGGWQSRIIGEFGTNKIEQVKYFPNVENIEIHNNGGDGKRGKAEGLIIDIYFDDYRAVIPDTPLIARQVGCPPEKIVYNYKLLSMYFIRSPQDTAPRLVLPMFAVITAMASISLIVIIYNAFAVYMNARIHQFGIFSSIGATPRQIRACLLQEAAALCTVPILMGNLFGIAGSMGLVQMIDYLLGNSIPGRHKAEFGYHPLVLILTLILMVLTVWLSAWLPARKLSRLEPLEAIRGSGELQLKRKKDARLPRLLFGVEGELAFNALKAQRKALRTASLSLVFSFLSFTVMQCFFSLSGISVRETYFEKYQDVWDIMVTVKDTSVGSFEGTGDIQELYGVESAVLYQKAMAKRMVTEEEMSAEMKSCGGFSHAPSNYVTKTDEGWLVNAPVVILDDNSFLDYCTQIGITPQLNGAVIRNQIRDVANPDFRHPDFMPYIKGESTTGILREAGNNGMEAEIPVLSYTEEVPVLREEYAAQDYYELVHFIPASLWEQIKDKIGLMPEELYIRILGRENAGLEELNALQDAVSRVISPKYTMECENRIQECETNNLQIQGMKAILGGFCILFAIIGIGSVFSNTLRFVRQRKREFARYLSVGLTPGGIRKMFCIEAIMLAARPILVTVPPAAIAVGYMLNASYVAVGGFLAEAPLMPVMVFMAAIFGSVLLAYYFAWRNVRNIRLAEVLRDDTAM